MFRVGDQIQVVAGLWGVKITPDGPQLGEVYTVTGIRATSTEARGVRLDRAVGRYSKDIYWSVSRFNLVAEAMVLYPGDKVRVIAGSQFLSVGELLTVVEVYTDYGYGNTETGLYRHFVIADVEKLMEPLDEGKTAEPGETLDSFKAKVYDILFTRRILMPRSDNNYGSRTWQELAHILAERVRYQAWQCPTHSNWRMGAKENCPFCCDTEAWELYKQKVKEKR